jgi:ECF transporter S component (folate family)
MKKNIRLVVTGGLLIALDVVCARFLGFYTPGNADRISPQFIPNALAGMIFGPLWGMMITVLGDTVGMLVNSYGLTFMPLITLACGARGLIYGLILYNKPVSIARCIVAVTAVTLIVELGMMPAFLSILYGKAWFGLFVAKLLTRIITIPVYGLILFAVAKGMQRAGLPLYSGAGRGMGK